MQLKAFTDAASDAVARAIAGVQREASRAEELRAAEHRAFMAEQREAAAVLLRRIEERLAAVRDGIDGKDGEPGPPGEQGPPGKDGERGPIGERGEQGVQGEKGDPGERGEKGEAGDRGETGERGADGAPGERGERGPIGERGAQGLPGERGETGERGLDGKDAYPGEARGLFDPEAEYRAMDVVTHNGSEWRAKFDNPGSLPGEGWMLSACRGKRGDRGERGLQGVEGRPGPGLLAGYVDAEDLKLMLTKEDGSELKIDLYDFANVIKSA